MRLRNTGMYSTFKNILSIKFRNVSMYLFLDRGRFYNHLGLWILFCVKNLIEFISVRLQCDKKPLFYLIDIVCKLSRIIQKVS
jgi:hypothetical protein